jgi:hypothetical protein
MTGLDKERNMPNTIGYLEGTDSIWLTSLLLLGHDTVPLANHVDGHGLNIQQISPQHHIDLIIGYLHKLVPLRGQDLTSAELLHATKVYDIPVLIACPAASHAAARTRLGQMPPKVTLVDPARMLAEVERLLGHK